MHMHAAAPHNHLLAKVARGLIPKRDFGTGVVSEESLVFSIRAIVARERRPGQVQTLYVFHPVFSVVTLIHYIKLLQGLYLFAHACV